MVDKTLISRKLQRVEIYLNQVRLKKDPGIDAFKKDRDLQSIILFNLIQSIQTCIDMGSHIISDSEWEMPGSQAEIFETLALNKVITRSLAKKMIQMAGFRNRIVHEYEKIDLKIVYKESPKNNFHFWRSDLGEIWPI